MWHFLRIVSCIVQLQESNQKELLPERETHQLERNEMKMDLEGTKQPDSVKKTFDVFQQGDHPVSSLKTDGIEETTISPHLRLFYFDVPVMSTMDEAKKIIETSVTGDSQAIAVIAKSQTKGRGTGGRTWNAGDGNLYLTIGFPLNKVPNLMPGLPLMTGLVIARRVDSETKECLAKEIGNDAEAPKVTLKWPNDVLINDLKVAGVLIESATINSKESWMLVGIGVNVANTPSLSGPGKHLRSATSLSDWCHSEPATDAKTIGLDVASHLADWVYGVAETCSDSTASKDIVEEWSKWAEFGKTYELRGRVVDENQGCYEGEEVVSLGVEANGQLRVQGKNGDVRLLKHELMH